MSKICAKSTDRDLDGENMDKDETDEVKQTFRQMRRR